MQVTKYLWVTFGGIPIATRTCVGRIRSRKASPCQRIRNECKKYSFRPLIQPVTVLVVLLPVSRAGVRPAVVTYSGRTRAAFYREDILLIVFREDINAAKGKHSAAHERTVDAIPQGCHGVSVSCASASGQDAHRHVGTAARASRELLRFDGPPERFRRA